MTQDKDKEGVQRHALHVAMNIVHYKIDSFQSCVGLKRKQLIVYNNFT